MLEKIHDLTIKGGFFDSKTILQDILKRPINILFGRNGSGKSTIGRALDEFSKIDLPNEQKQFEKIELCNEPTNELKKAIHVFNEDFIEKYVNIEDDALGPIVMLGNQVDITNQIVQKSKEIANAERKFEEQLEIDKKLNDINCKESPEYKFKNLKTKLSSSGEWADIDSRCRTQVLRRNSSITCTTIEQFHEILKTKGLSEADYKKHKKDFDQNFSFFQLTEGKSKIDIELKLYSFPVNIDELRLLLAKQLKKPKLNEREQLIVQIVCGEVKRLDETKSFFSKSENKICPFCYRPIETNEKEEICHHIERILNKETEDYIENLKSIQSNLINIEYNYASIEYLFPTQCALVKQTIKSFNERLKKIKCLIDSKLNNVYGSFSEELNVENIMALIKDVNNALSLLQVEVKKYNSSIEERANKAKELNDLNYILTANKYKAEIEDYLESKQKQIKSLEQKNKIDSDLNRLKYELSILQQSLEQTKIALDFINECLKYIYFSKDRLILEEGEKCYRLKSNGAFVQPGHVSVGERNIIALCYFFASLFDHVRKEEQYRQELLLVIDDPISSFDIENRMGVLSFLRWQISKVLKGNDKSRILIMSHDLQTIFDLQKITKELINKKGYWELENKRITNKRSNGNEYNELLRLTYEFAIQRNPESSNNLNSIGNVMRRLLEAYFSFNYKKAFYDYVCTEEFLSVLPKQKRIYYGNLMTRLVLNGCSHEEESINSLSDLFAMFTAKELQITAKSILSMIYLLNKLHVKQYLGDDAINKLEEWQNSKFDEIVS